MGACLAPGVGAHLSLRLACYTGWVLSPAFDTEVAFRETSDSGPHGDLKAMTLALNLN